MRVRWNSMGGNFLMKEAELMRKLAMSQIKRQIEILATFLPDEVLDMPLAELNKVQNYVGVLLFADVSGFTPLTEKYNKSGRGGIYRLTATLNAYIGAIVEVIYFFGGDVLKFSGDAFLAMWKAPPTTCMYKVIHEVVVCALFIQQNLGIFETEVNVLLKVKVAIACGNLTFSIIGDEQNKHYIVVGPPIADVKTAERVSVSGDVVISPNAWGHVADESYDVTYASEGHVKVWRCLYKSTEKGKKEEYVKKQEVVLELCDKHIKHRNALHMRKKFDSTLTDSKLTEEFLNALPPRIAIKNTPRHWIATDLKPFIIKPVQEQVEEMQPLEYLTEMREITIQFINIVPNTTNEKTLVIMVDTAYQIICNVIGRLLGVVNKVSLFDKDAMVLVLFGLRGIKHELESQNALKSAYKIRNSIAKLDGVESVSVGVTNGLVYCGVVGHPLRREYTVIGGAVNKAARIMCAYEGKVTCDVKTYMNSKLASYYFQLQSKRKLKGIEDSGNIYEYNEDFEDAVSFDQFLTPLLGRTAQVDLVSTIVNKPLESENYRGVCFYGKFKIGKTKLLRTNMALCAREGHTIAAIDLCGTSQRPYFTVSKLYGQFYDARTKLKGGLNNLPREQWDVVELLSNPISYEKKQSMIKRFGEVTRGSRTGVSIMVIDNIQLIDLQSFEIVLSSLSTENLRLICGGQFEEDTWDIQWKLSMSGRVKMVELEPLGRRYIAPLICQFLNVRGVPKKMVGLLTKICQGRPGWIQSCLLRFINNAGVEIKYVLKKNKDTKTYVFPPSNLITCGRDRSVNDKIADRKLSILPVAELSPEFHKHDDDITLAAVSLDLFDSFTPYQQLVIKTGAVLGDIFTRMLILIMLKYPNEITFATTIKNLFEEEVFDCGTKYISMGGFTVDDLQCYCFFNEVEYTAFKCHKTNLPKYAFCKLLHFKNKSLRSVAYELLPANQRKELHSRITDVLENQTNQCPNCLRDNSIAMIHLVRFKDMMKYCNKPKLHISVENRPIDEHTVNEEFFKDLIRDSMRIDESDQQLDDIEIPKRQYWNPCSCYCLEMLMRVYGDLIFHSEKAGHIGKRIFFLMQYGAVLMMMSEYDDAIPYLSDASELCMLDAKQPDAEITATFRRIHVGKIQFYLAEAYYRKGQMDIAKNHLAISLRQYNVPMMALRYTLPNKIMNRFCLSRKQKFVPIWPRRANTLFKNDLAKCLNIVSNVLAAEGFWTLAKHASIRSLSLLGRHNPNVFILCDVFSNAIELYNFCGDAHICEKLERYVSRDILRNYTSNHTIELVAIGKLVNIFFRTRVMSGEIKSAIKVGYRSLDINYNVQSYFVLNELLSVLATILLLSQRIEDAVYVIRILRNIAATYEASALVGYYAFAVELVIETSFILEPIEQCDEFAEEYFSKSKSVALTPVENKLLIYLHCYYLRCSKWNRALRWKTLFMTDKLLKYSYIAVNNTLKFTECSLMILNRNTEMRKTFIELEEKKVESFLADCEALAKRWVIFMPRVLTYKAYYNTIKNRPLKTAVYLKEGETLAEKAGNVLECCWIWANRSTWKGGYSFGNDMKLCDWRSAHTYSQLQWSQIMFPLPHDIA